MLRLRAAIALVALVAAPAAGPLGAPALRWEQWRHLPLVVDVAGPRSDGALVVAAGGRLFVLSAHGPPRVLAPSYHAAPGEPYIAVAGRGCFGRDDVYTLDLRRPLGVLRIDRRGRVSRFATIAGVRSLTGIAFDVVGSFGGPLLVTGSNGGRTTLVAVDCTGRARRITTRAPRIEGGIAVAPAGFGRYAGALIAPDERSGGIYAVGPDGSSSVVARPRLPRGGDVGVESVGFVPPGFSGDAYLADRSSPGSPTSGTDTILRLGAIAVRGAGVHDGDLIVATEAGARTLAVHCAVSCTTTELATASAAAHVEGHITFSGGLGPATLRTVPVHNQRRIVALAVAGAAILVAAASALLLLKEN
jgi:hypothetical protein